MYYSLMDALLAGGILALTLLFILIRPKDIGEAWWAVLGGALALVLGLVPIRDVWGIVVETHDALFLLLGMMALSSAADRAGFFDWAASLAARAGGGDVRRLYVMVFLVGTVVTAFLSLDATAIILTPIVYGMVVRLRLRPLPFVFACTYTANTASLFLPVSNLTNLLAYNAFDMNFIRFGVVMFIPATFAVVANLLVFLVLFRGDLIGGYDEDHFFEAENPAFSGSRRAGSRRFSWPSSPPRSSGSRSGLWLFSGGRASFWRRGFSGGCRSGRFRVRFRGGFSRSSSGFSSSCEARRMRVSRR
ncbi:MAG: anion permease [Rubrobacter sp.]|nr:anion permease [Rubrobacter sp.]